MSDALQSSTQLGNGRQNSLVSQPKNLALATATLADLDYLVTLDRLCFGVLWSRDTYMRELNSPNSEILLVRSVSDSVRIDPATSTTAQAMPLGYGCLWTILDEAHITILGVHPQHRRQGLGRHLLQGLLSAACQHDLTRATLEVSTQNHAAIALYEQFGFQQAGCRKHYYSNGDDAAIFWKSGLQHPNFQCDLDNLVAYGREPTG